MNTEWIKQIDWQTEPLYLEIARALAQGIRERQLVTGELLPTHRKLASQLGVAIGTVTRAYAEVEQKGLIHGRGRRGTMVGKPRKGKDSLTSLMADQSSLIDLSINYPSSSLDPDILPVLRQMSKTKTSRHLLRYSDIRVLQRPRSSGARWLKSMGLEVEAQQVIPTAGAQHALNITFSTLTQPGDTIVAESLSYPGIKAVADMLNLKLLGVSMDAEGILPDALEVLCRNRSIKVLYTIPTLQNPTNAVLSKDRKREIIQIADKYDVAIVEDEIHRRLVPEPPPLFAAMAPHRSYLIASTSKLVAGGLRVGFLVGPPQMYQQLVQTFQASIWTVAPLCFEIFHRWMQNGTVENVVEKRQQESEDRYRIMRKILDGFEIQGHPASYFLWLKLPPAWTQMQFSIEARNQGVAVATAESFAIEEKEAPHAVRLCYVTPDNQEILITAAERLAHILSSKPTRFSATL